MKKGIFKLQVFRRRKPACRAVAAVSAFAVLMATPLSALATSYLSGNAELTAHYGIDAGSIVNDADAAAFTAAGNHALLDWSKLSVGAGQSMSFNGNATFYNVVSGGDATEIAGALHAADGSLWIFNPAGVSFVGGSAVNVGGLFGAVAAGLDNKDDIISAITSETTVPLPLLGDSGAGVSVDGGAGFTADQVVLLGKTVGIAGTTVNNADFSGVNQLTIGAAGKIVVDEVSGGRVSIDVSDFAADDSAFEVSVGGLEVGREADELAGIDARAGDVDVVTEGNINVLEALAAKGDISFETKAAADATVVVGHKKMSVASGKLLQGKSVSATAAGRIEINGDVEALDGDVDIDAAEYIAVGSAATVTATGGNVEMSSTAGNINMGGTIAATGDVVLEATGTGANGTDKSVKIGFDGSASNPAASVSGKSVSMVGKMSSQVLAGSVTATGTDATDGVTMSGGEYVAVNGAVSGKNVTLETTASATLTTAHPDIGMPAKAPAGVLVTSDGTVSAADSLTIASKGIINAAGEVSVSSAEAGTGVSTFSAEGKYEGAAAAHDGEISLSNDGNAIFGKVNVEGENVDIKGDASDFSYGTVSAGADGNLTIHGNARDVTIADAVDISGDLTIEGAADISIESGISANDVTLKGTKTTVSGDMSGHDLAVRSADGTASADMKQTGGTINMSGTITAADIEQSGGTMKAGEKIVANITQAGCEIDTPVHEGNLTQTHADDIATVGEITGDVTQSAGLIRAKNTEHDYVNLSIDGSLSQTGGGKISDVGTLTIGKTDAAATAVSQDAAGTIEATAVVVNVVDGTDVTLAGSANKLGSVSVVGDGSADGDAKYRAGAVSVTDAATGGIVLDTLKADTLTVTAAGDVSQLGAADVAGLADVTAVGAGDVRHEVSLLAPANKFGLVKAKGEKIEIKEKDDVVIAGIDGSILYVEAGPSGDPVEYTKTITQNETGDIKTSYGARFYGSSVKLDNDGNAIGPHFSARADNGDVEIVNNAPIGIENDAYTDVDGVTASGAVKLTAKAGDITMYNGAELSGASIDLTAETGNISLDSGKVLVTAADGAATLTAAKGSVTAQNADNVFGDVTASAKGDIALKDKGALALTDVQTTEGDVSVSAGGQIAATKVYANGEGKNISLSTTADGIEVADVQAAGKVTLNAATSITTADGGKVQSKDLDAAATTGVALKTAVETATVKDTGTGSITVEEDDAVTLGEVTASAGDVRVLAGSLTVADADVVKISGQNVRLEATGGALAIGARVSGDNVTLKAANGITENAAVNATSDKYVNAADGDINVNANATVGGSLAYVADGETALVKTGTDVALTPGAGGVFFKKDSTGTMTSDGSATSKDGVTTFTDVSEVAIETTDSVVVNNNGMSVTVGSYTCDATITEVLSDPTGGAGGDGTESVQLGSDPIEGITAKDVTINVTGDPGTTAVSVEKSIIAKNGDVAINAENGDVVVDGATVKAGTFTVDPVTGAVTIPDGAAVGNLKIKTASAVVVKNAAQVGASGTVDVDAKAGGVTVTGEGTALAANGAMTVDADGGTVAVTEGAFVGGNDAVTIGGDGTTASVGVAGGTVVAKKDLTATATGMVLVEGASNVASDKAATLTGANVMVSGEDTFVGAKEAVTIRAVGVKSVVGDELTITDGAVTIQEATVKAGSFTADADGNVDTEAEGYTEGNLVIDADNSIYIGSGAQVGASGTVDVDAGQGGVQVVMHDADRPTRLVANKAMTIDAGTVVTDGGNDTVYGGGVTVMLDAYVGGNDAVTIGGDGTTKSVAVYDGTVAAKGALSATATDAVSVRAGAKVASDASTTLEGASVTVDGTTTLVAAKDDVTLTATGTDVSISKATVAAKGMVVADAEKAVEVGGTVSAEGDVRMNAGTTLTVTEGDADRIAAGGNVRLESAGKATVNAGVGGKNVTVVSTGDAVETGAKGTLSATGGDLYVKAKGAVTLAGDASAAKANDDGGAMAVVSENDAVAATGTLAADTLYVKAKGNVALSKLEAANAGLEGEGDIDATFVADATVAAEAGGHAKIAVEGGDLAVGETATAAELKATEVLADPAGGDNADGTQEVALGDGAADQPVVSGVVAADYVSLSATKTDEGEKGNVVVAKAVESTGGNVYVGAEADATVDATVTAAQNATVTAGEDVNVNADITATAGDAYVEADDGDVKMASGTKVWAKASGKSARIAADGSVELSQVEAANVSVKATGGDITDSLGAETANVKATNLRLEAGGDIGEAKGDASDGDNLNVDVANIEVKAGGDAIVAVSDAVTVGIDGDAGDIAVSKVGATGAVEGSIADANLESGIDAGGTATLVAGGKVTVAEAVKTGNDLLVEATAGGIEQNAEITAGNSVSVIADDGNVEQKANITATAGTIDVEATNGSIAMSDGTTAKTTGQNIRYKAEAGLTISKIDAGNGSVTLDALGDLTASLDSSVTADGLAVKADKVGKPDAKMKFSVSKLAVNSANDVYVDNDKSVAVIDAKGDDFKVDRVNADGTSGSAQSENINGVVAHDGSVDLDVTDGSLTIDSGSSVSATESADIGASGSVDVDGTVSGKTAAITAGGSVAVNGTVSGNSANVSAGSDVGFGANGQVSGGNVNIKAGGDITQDGASVDVDGRGFADSDNVHAAVKATGAAVLDAGGSIGTADAGTSDYVGVDAGTVEATAKGDVAVAGGDGSALTLGNSGISAGGNVALYTTDTINPGDATIKGNDITVTEQSFSGGILDIDLGGKLTVNSETPGQTLLAIFDTAGGSKNVKVNNQPNGAVIFVDGRLVGGDLKTINKLGSMEAFPVQTPELKSEQGVFGNPNFLHDELDVANPIAVGAIDFLLLDIPRLTLSSDFPLEVEKQIAAAGLNPTTSYWFGQKSNEEVKEDAEGTGGDKPDNGEGKGGDAAPTADNQTAMN